MQDFVVTTEKTTKIFSDCQFIDVAAEYTVDFSPWAEKYGTVTAVTWTVINGTVAISGQALANDVATALITFSSAGANLIQVKANNGTEITTVYLDLMCKDPQNGSDDYGF